MMKIQKKIIMPLFLFMFGLSIAVIFGGIQANAAAPGEQVQVPTSPGPRPAAGQVPTSARPLTVVGHPAPVMPDAAPLMPDADPVAPDAESARSKCLRSCGTNRSCRSSCF